MILDFPLHVRQKLQQRILYMLCKGKPDWEAITLHLSADLKKSFFKIKWGSLNLKLNYTSVFLIYLV